MGQRDERGRPTRETERDQPTRETSRDLHERATDVLPGGVSHNIRHFEPHPVYLDGARGATVTDVDGNEYVDFWMNHIASVLGHAHPDVVEAVQAQAADGLHYGAPNREALALAERVVEVVPSSERVRFCASGTEATMYAVRLARAWTDRPRILKAEGGWHGGNTDLAAAVHAPYDESETMGLAPGAAEHVHAFPVNDRGAVEALFDEHEGEIAGVIIEPMLLAGGGVEAEPAFLEFLREKTEETGTLLVFDEVVTGFRFSPGTAQARVGVTPDLTTLGKFLGGGLPVGALAGRADLFEAARPDVDVDPDRRVLAGGGTFTMNPMTATAGLASLEVLETQPVFEQTESEGARVREGLRDVFEDRGVDAAVLGDSSLFCPHFSPAEPLVHVGAVETGTDREALEEFHRRLLDRGFYFLPGHVGAVSSQTTGEQLDRFLDAADAVCRDLQADGVL